MFLKSQTNVLKPRIIKGGNLQIEIFPFNNGNIDFKSGVRCAIKTRSIVVIRKVIETRAVGMFGLEVMDNNVQAQVGFDGNNFIFEINTGQQIRFVTQDVIDLECFADLLRLWPIGLILSDFKQKEEYEKNKNNIQNQQGNFNQNIPNFNQNNSFNPNPQNNIPQNQQIPQNNMPQNQQMPQNNIPQNQQMPQNNMPQNNIPQNQQNMNNNTMTNPNQTMNNFSDELMRDINNALQG